MNFFKKIISKYFKTFVYFYRQLKHRFFLIVFFSLFVGVLDGFGLAMFMPLLEIVNNPNGANGGTLGKIGFIVKSIELVGFSINLISVLALLVVFFSLKGLAKFFTFSYITSVRQYFVSKLRLEIIRAFNLIQYKHYVTSDVGRIQNTMTGEVERVNAGFQSYTSALEQGALVVVYMFFAFFIDPLFAVLVCVGGGMTNLIYNRIYKKTKIESKRYTQEFHQYQGQVIQYVSNYKYLKATAFLTNYSDKLENSIKTIEASRKRVGILNAILLGLREPIVIIVVVAVILIQTQILKAPLGPIIISLLFFYRALTALTTVQNAYGRFLELSGSMDNVLEFQKELSQNKEKYGKTKLSVFNKNIKLSKVSFAYGEEVILKEIDLLINKNEVIAFVGESGSGKTTLVNLIAGLIPITIGNMSIDDLDSSQIDLRSLQYRIGYITQEPVIFSDTIFNNVTLWDAMNEENWNRFTIALEKAALGNFVSELTDGANTILGINGVNLSGGQKQRISIARELYKNVDILIMDEATSALDTETERMIQESMDKLKGEYTILIVAHRLSTIKNADKIVLMNKGNIEAVGDFDKIMIDSPMFNKMVAVQQI